MNNRMKKEPSSGAAKPLNVLVCDDEQGQLTTWKSHIVSANEGAPLKVSFLNFDPATGFDHMLEVLTARRRRARGIHTATSADVKLPLDDADVVILDYDILRSGEHAFVTGEELAYLARCYSSCGAIVSLNQVEWKFDLRLWSPEVVHSFADVNIRATSLQESGLWRQTWVDEGACSFRPWSWPMLPELASRLKSLTQYVQGALSEPILPALGLDNPKLLQRFSKRTLDAFYKEGDPKRAVEIKFRDFLDVAPQGKKTKDAVPNENFARVIASRVLNWLWYDLLPSQDVIVDYPHLVYRAPELLEATGEELRALNELARHRGSSERYPRHRVKELEQWLPFPVFSWPDWAGSVDPFALRGKPRFVFCEDVSSFQPMSECQSIETDVGGVFSTRWVRRIHDQAYGPRTRLFR